MKRVFRICMGLSSGAVLRNWPVLTLFVLWWWWVASRGVTAIVAPSPARVFSDIFGSIDVYLPPLAITFGTAILGLACGVLIGALVGTAVWMSSLVAGLVTPGALIIRVVPMTALVPILARVFGYSGFTVFLIVVMLVFFPAFVLTVSGLSATPPGATGVFTVIGASRWGAIRLLHLPSAVQNIMLALRISAPFSVGAVLLAQYLMAAGGLGDLMRQSHNFSQYEREWGVAIVATTLSVVIFGLARLAEERVRDRIT